MLYDVVARLRRGENKSFIVYVNHRPLPLGEAEKLAAKQRQKPKVLEVKVEPCKNQSS